MGFGFGWDGNSIEIKGIFGGSMWNVKIMCGRRAYVCTFGLPQKIFSRKKTRTESNQILFFSLCICLVAICCCWFQSNLWRVFFPFLFHFSVALSSCFFFVVHKKKQDERTILPLKVTSAKRVFRLSVLKKRPPHRLFAVSSVRALSFVYFLHFRFDSICLGEGNLAMFYMVLNGGNCVRDTHQHQHQHKHEHNLM